MELLHQYSRRNVLKTGLATAAAAAVTIPKAKAQVSPPDPKKPGELLISAVMEVNPTLEGGIRPIMNRVKNSRFWWAGDYRPITPEILGDTDLLLTFYSSHLYNKENTAAIIDSVKNRGMGWIAVHNTPWFAGEELNGLLGADCILHREIQPVIICDLNQNHPITKGIEPFIINLDEQFGLFLRNPDDPDVAVLFKSQGVHDKRWTIQGLCAQRGKGRVVTLTPGHYEWSWYQVQYQEIMWRAAHWALNLPIEPFYGSFENFIW